MQSSDQWRSKLIVALRHCLCAGCLGLALSAPVVGQSVDPPVAAARKLSGPRVGVTFLSEGTREKLRNDAGIEVGPAMTQFGWQFEKRFYTTSDGPTAVTEWVLLVGGLDQGVALPSISWLVGMRTRSGAEFGVGPNMTPGGAVLAFAAGLTFRAGALNLPVNVALVPSKLGTRVSVLAGFNTER
jgi:hypothetical protein